MLRIKEIVRGFFCHSERKLRDIRRGLGAANAWHSSIMHSACPSATPFPVTSAACLITRLHAGFLPQRQHTQARSHRQEWRHTHMQDTQTRFSPLRQTDYSYLGRKTSVKTLGITVPGHIHTYIISVEKHTSVLWEVKCDRRLRKMTAHDVSFFLVWIKQCLVCCQHTRHVELIDQTKSLVIICIVQPMHHLLTVYI